MRLWSWLGWALFYGACRRLGGLVIVCAAGTPIVRWEERRLLERFGDEYQAYRAASPSWVGRTGS